MDNTDFIEFLESIGMMELNVKDAYLYKEYKNKHIIHQKIYSLNPGSLSLHLYILIDGERIIQKIYDFKLSDPGLKGKIIGTIFSFYDIEGIIPDNLKSYIRENKIKEILN